MNFNSRKIRKPLMERKRRARINQSLDELQQLLTATDFTAKGTKLEKADILEMTVQYLRQTQRNDGNQEIKENLENLMLERYLLGFEKCAEEVTEMPELDVNLRLTIKTHLKNCLENVKNQKKSRPEGAGNENGYIPKSTCSVLIQEPLRILPSKLPNGGVIFLVSSNADSGGSLGKTQVWRPWW